MGDVNHEPTMEEILASIKKIIAEDNHPAASRPVAMANRPVREPIEASADDEVLELTEAVEPGSLGRRDSSLSPAPASDDTLLVSEDAARASREAFAALSAAVMPSASAPGAIGEHTLEWQVRDKLRPMLKKWVDANLPGIVEQMVAGEIKRISGRSD